MMDKAKLYFKKIQLKNKQRVITKKFNKDGPTNEVLEAQLELNQLRNELDIPDSNELLDGKFAQ